MFFRESKTKKPNVFLFFRESKPKKPKNSRKTLTWNQNFSKKFCFFGFLVFSRFRKHHSFCWKRRVLLREEFLRLYTTFWKYKIDAKKTAGRSLRQATSTWQKRKIEIARFRLHADQHHHVAASASASVAELFAALRRRRLSSHCSGSRSCSCGRCACSRIGCRCPRRSCPSSRTLPL